MASNVAFSFSGIELLEYAMKASDRKIPENAQYKYNINIEYRFANNQNVMFVVVAVQIFLDDETTELCSVKISCNYNIENLDDFKQSNNISLPDEFITTTNSISLSTVRGVLFTLFRGTYLHNVILPIIDPSNFTAQKK